MRLKTIILAAALSGVPGLLHAQFDFKLAGKDIQVHSFASQGFLYTNVNNYLTMKTDGGSFAFTDAGMNMSVRVTDKFRVGGQVYVRKLGELSKGQVSLDWASADYRFADWFGIRGGKVKTTLGLYNDVQDMDFLNTFAIMPQSMYPLDLRSSTIAHTGGDIYGSIAVKHLGSLAYTLYAGMRPNDPHDGYRYLMDSLGMPLKSYTGRMLGGDVRWNTPLKGLLAGTSYLDQRPHSEGAGVRQDARKNFISQFYVQYSLRNLRIDGEYRRDYRFLTVANMVLPSGGNPPAGGGGAPAGGGGAPAGGAGVVWDSRSWYTAAAYRISKRLEAGGYYSRFVALWSGDANANDNHIYDRVVTVRLDLTSHWNLKVEEHFMDGYGAMDSSRGFYSGGMGLSATTFQPKTNLFVVRTGLNF